MRGKNTLHCKIEDVICNYNFQPHKHLHKNLQKEKHKKRTHMK
jgi:hypothetical protein